MITIKSDPSKPKKDEIPALQVFEEILEKVNSLGACGVSDQRQHAIESQIRAVIRLMGYRPRETAEKPASIAELCAQAHRALKLLNGELPEARFDDIARYAIAVHSNLAAEVGELSALPKIVPEQEIPPAPAAQS